MADLIIAHLLSRWTYSVADASMETMSARVVGRSGYDSHCLAQRRTTGSKMHLYLDPTAPTTLQATGIQSCGIS